MAPHFFIDKKLDPDLNFMSFNTKRFRPESEKAVSQTFLGNLHCNDAFRHFLETLEIFLLTIKRVSEIFLSWFSQSNISCFSTFSLDQ